MQAKQSALFSELYRKVISSASVCTGCGACVLICPKDRLIFNDGRPQQISGDKSICPENTEGRCGLCAKVCPRLNGERGVGEPEKNPIGKYTTAVAARTTDKVLADLCQDGGLVSSIFKWGLLSEKWSSFIGYTRDENWRISPLIVTNSNEVKNTCGTKYTYASIVEGLSELHRSGLASSPFAIVGLPCHIAAIRKLQEMKSKYLKGLVLCIGLFCTKAFSYEGLINDKLVNEMGLIMRDVNKMDIRKGSLHIALSSGESHQIPVKELGDYGHPGCSCCDDFSAELADISVGGLGVPDRTIALIRTEAGAEAMKAAESYGLIETGGIEEYQKAWSLLEKLSLRKREQAAECIE
jgi:coenzyme F420 hydrogenase subunit beta